MNCGVIDILADPAVKDEPLPTQHSQTGRDSGLSHPEGLLQLGNSQFFFQQERQQTEAGGLRERTERLED